VFIVAQVLTEVAVTIVQQRIISMNLVVANVYIVVLVLMEAVVTIVQQRPMNID
jgi:hypothetical protein